MRKNYRKSKSRIAPSRQYRVNTAITADKVRLLDENDEHIGIVSIEDALRKAREAECDLVEIQPAADPPVCRITDYNKLKYSLEKEWRKQRAHQKKVETKCIRLSLRIGEHDLEVRRGQAKKFLEGNDKVKIEIALRGRERQHTQLAKEIIQRFIDSLKKEGFALTAEGDVSIQMGRLSATIGLKN